MDTQNPHCNPHHNPQRNSHHNPQRNCQCKANPSCQRIQPENSTDSASRPRSESASNTGTRSDSGTGTASGAVVGAHPLPFPPREFADKGTKWLLGHPGHLRHLMRVLALDVSQLLDFAGMEPVLTEQVSEPVLKQTADRIFRVPLRSPGGERAAAEGGDSAAAGDITAACAGAATGAATTHPDPDRGRRHATVVLLVEHQSTQQRLLSMRLLSYMVRLWDLERRRGEQDKLPESQWRLEPIIPLVFYTGRVRWPRPVSLAWILNAPASLKAFVPSFQVLHFPVRHLSREALRPEESAFGQLLCLMRLAAAPLAELRAELARAVPRLEALTTDDVAEWRDLLYYLQLFLAYYRTPEEGRILSTALVAAHQDRTRREEMETMGKTYFQALIEEGREVGIKEGKEIGIEEGKEVGIREGKEIGIEEGDVRGRRLMLLNQLEAKFGPLPATVVQTMKRQSVAQLDALAVRLIKAETLEELGLG